MSISAEPNQKRLLEAYKREGDAGARDRLIEEMIPLVRALATRYAGRGEAVEDLVQVGSIGLIKAIDRFDLDRGVELSTYAVPTIVDSSTPLSRSKRSIALIKPMEPTCTRSSTASPRPA